MGGPTLAMEVVEAPAEDPAAPRARPRRRRRRSPPSGSGGSGFATAWVRVLERGGKWVVLVFWAAVLGAATQLAPRALAELRLELVPPGDSPGAVAAAALARAFPRRATPVDHVVVVTVAGGGNDVTSPPPPPPPSPPAPPAPLPVPPTNTTPPNTRAATTDGAFPASASSGGVTGGGAASGGVTGGGAASRGVTGGGAASGGVTGGGAASGSVTGGRAAGRAAMSPAQFRGALRTLTDVLLNMTAPYVARGALMPQPAGLQGWATFTRHGLPTLAAPFITPAAAADAAAAEAATDAARGVPLHYDQAVTDNENGSSGGSYGGGGGGGGGGHGEFASFIRLSSPPGNYDGGAAIDMLTKVRDELPLHAAALGLAAASAGPKIFTMVGRCRLTLSNPS